MAKEELYDPKKATKTAAQLLKPEMTGQQQLEALLGLKSDSQKDLTSMFGPQRSYDDKCEKCGQKHIAYLQHPVEDQLLGICEGCKLREDARLEAEGRGRYPAPEGRR
jgi:hypothetical protein